ncbi:MAG: hypothetical protein PHI59_00545 [Candidatus Omnitrophica bacterium]|nr:hypothetical protein [Candidatus Omnitrophota bacterium]
MKRENLVINIAGLPLDVKNRYDILQQPIYEEFICKSKKRNKRCSHFPANKHYPHFPISDGKLISYAYSQLLALNKGMLLHAAAVVKDGEVFIFFGKAGAGKSTIAGLSRKHRVLGDDIIAARRSGAHYYAFSTPWAQAPFIRPDKNTKGKISAVFFIKKSNRISFKLLPPEDALMRILSAHIHFLTYTGKPLAGNIFLTAADFTRKIPAYEMEFSKNRNFWRTLEAETNAVRPQ